MDLLTTAILVVLMVMVIAALIRWGIPRGRGKEGLAAGRGGAAGLPAMARRAAAWARGAMAGYAALLEPTPHHVWDTDPITFRLRELVKHTQALERAPRDPTAYRQVVSDLGWVSVAWPCETVQDIIRPGPWVQRGYGAYDNGNYGGAFLAKMRATAGELRAAMIAAWGGRRDGRDGFKPLPGGVGSFNLVRMCTGTVLESVYGMANTTIGMIGDTFRGALSAAGLTTAQIEAESFWLALSAYWEAMAKVFRELNAGGDAQALDKLYPQLLASLDTISEAALSPRAAAALSGPTGKAFLAAARKQAKNVASALSTSWNAAAHRMNCL